MTVETAEDLYHPDLGRRAGRARARPALHPPHPDPDLALPQRARRGRALLQVREPAEGRRLQGARRLQRGLRPLRREGAEGRRHPLLGQPRPLALLRGRPPRHPLPRGRCRDRPAGEEGRGARLRRQSSPNASPRPPRARRPSPRCRPRPAPTSCTPTTTSASSPGRAPAPRRSSRSSATLDAVVAPIGGGGMISGTCLTLSTIAPADEDLRRRARGGRRRLPVLQAGQDHRLRRAEDRRRRPPGAAEGAHLALRLALRHRRADRLRAGDHRRHAAYLGADEDRDGALARPYRSPPS